MYICNYIIYYYFIIKIIYLYFSNPETIEISLSVSYVHIKKSYRGIPETLVEKRIIINSSLPIPQTEYTKYYKNNNDLLYIKTNDTYDGFEHDLNTKMYNSTAEFIIMKNIYVSYASAYATNDFTYLNVEKNKKNSLDSKA